MLTVTHDASLRAVFASAMTFVAFVSSSAEAAPPASLFSSYDLLSNDPHNDP
jgi:hypothetical protein